jgi:trimethylamine---corrinoid protein Co-methyltransferase
MAPGPRTRIDPLEVLDEDALEAIHAASLEILRTVGMDFLHPEAIAVLRAHGADVEDDGPRVRLDPDLVMEWVGRAPSAFTIHARNPDHDLRIGGRHVVFLSVASAPNVSDLDRGRRPGTFADFEDLVRLGQSFNVVHGFGGYPVEPQDLAPAVRHLHALRLLRHAQRQGVACLLPGEGPDPRRDRDRPHRVAGSTSRRSSPSPRSTRS